MKCEWEAFYIYAAVENQSILLEINRVAGKLVLNINVIDSSSVPKLYGGDLGTDSED